MDEIFRFLLEYKYLLLFVFVMAEQAGVPLPALPVLLAAGALMRTGQIDPATALGLGVTASLVSDIAWYELGRRKGSRVLHLLCRISLEPDSCVRRTEEVFARHGIRSLAVAKFVPGLNIAAPPLAGVFGMHFGRFLLYDTLGAVMWLGALLGIGYAFGNQIEAVVARAEQLGVGLLAALGAPLAAYLSWKLYQRQRFLRELRIARITPEELKARIDAGEDLVTVDLRHALEHQTDPATVPGARHLPVEEVERLHGDLPRDRDLILLCT